MLYRIVTEQPAGREGPNAASMKVVSRRNRQLSQRRRYPQDFSARVALIVLAAILALSGFGVTIANGSTSGSFEWETFEKGVFTVYYATFADTADNVVTNSSTNFIMNFLDLESNSANPCGTLAYSPTRNMPPFWSILYPNATAPWHPDGSQDSQYPSKTPANEGDSVLMYWDAGSNGWYWCTKPAGNARVFPQISTDPNAFDTSLRLNFIALSETPIGCQLPLSEDGYEIASANDLDQIGTTCDASADYVFTVSSVNLSGGWTPRAFSGTLKGVEGRTTIENLTSNAGGLFTSLTDATIENLTIRGANASNSGAIGLITGVASGSVTLRNIMVDDSSVEGTGTSSGPVGGLIGHINDPSAHLQIEAFTISATEVLNGTSFTGGVIGYIQEATSVSIVDLVIDANSTAKGTFYVGGLIGENDEAFLTIDRARIDATIEGSGAYIGGLVGLYDANSAGANISRSRVSPASVVGNSWDAGGMAGDAQAAMTVTDVFVSTTMTGSGSGRHGGGFGSVGSGNSLFTVSMTNVGFNVPTVSGNSSKGGVVGLLNWQFSGRVAGSGLVRTSASGLEAIGGIQVDSNTTSATEGLLSSTDALAATSHTDQALRSMATFANAGWDIQLLGASGCATTWAIDDGNAYPVLQFDSAAPGYEMDVDACGETSTPIEPPTSEPTAIAIQTPTGDPLPATLMRNLPFDIRVTLVDANGDPVDNATEPATVTLVAAGGGTPGELRFAFREPATPVTLTLPVGESSIVFEDVVFTGLSAEDAMGDVTLTATIEGGSGDGLTEESPGVSFRDIAMTVTPVASELPADGVSTTQLTVELTDVDGEPQAGQTIRMTTTLGTLHAGSDATGSGAQEVSTETNANGIATFTLRASNEAGVATVAAFCPGSCPVATTVTFIGAIEGLTPIPGNERGWVAFNAPEGVESLETEIRDSGASTEPTLRTVQANEPVRLDGLANGKAVDVRLRAIFDETRRGPWSETVTFTPSEDAEAPAGAPTFETLDDRITLEPDPDGNANAGTFTVTLRASNDTDTLIQNAWLQALDVPDHVQIVSLEASSGTIERVTIENLENWFWRNANLEPTQEDTPIDTLATITVTLRVEVK